MRHAREALSDLEQNTEALKHNWFFRGFFNRRGYFDLDAITPAEYRKGALTRSGRRALRIWVRADRLFQDTLAGELELSEDGRARVDSAMSTFLDYPLDNPLVIEGYAASGTKADDFQMARARAGVVREYVIQRFALNPQTVAMMPLVGPAPDSPEGRSWEGVALALFVTPDDLEPATRTETEARPERDADRDVASTADSVETAVPVTPER
jgi:phospholipid/cholesterol/gamma-HCH transport system substrate-binding protein